MLRLTMLGGLTLAVDDGLVTGPMTQRRRLALLALLAIAGHRGMSRDRILACLWPESDAAHARHSLNQQLYAQRQLMAGRELFLGGKTLRLNPDVISADVTELEDSLDGGRLEEAVALYTGPFLDGFFIRDAPEFEQWVDTQRLRLARRVCAAFGDLANGAAARGDQAGAADWRRRAAELDPLDSQMALDMVQALVGAGNRGGALRHALRHMERLDQELGAAPDRRLVELMESLRAGSPPT